MQRKMDLKKTNERDQKTSKKNRHQKLVTRIRHQKVTRSNPTNKRVKMRVSRNWAKVSALLLVSAALYNAARMFAILPNRTNATAIKSVIEAQTVRHVSPPAATASITIDDECAALLDRVARALGTRAQDARRAMATIPKMCATVCILEG